MVLHWRRAKAFTVPALPVIMSASTEIIQLYGPRWVEMELGLQNNEEH